MPKSNPFVDIGVDNTIIIRSFDLKLINGLVYSTVKYSKGWIGEVISPEGNKIEQSRLTLSNFLSA